ncbi:MAG: O-methyltransferase [Bacteroidia bacterium]|nr:O-methyltransferase [Bacteroidia bacterium]
MDFISPAINLYCENHSTAEPELLQQLNRDTWAKVLNPRMLSGHLQGRFLSTISKMIRPDHILEIGTYTGYSALCLAEGLSRTGQLTTIDINDELESFSNVYFRKSTYSEKIIQRTGNALEIIPTLTQTFDLVFIDADKEHYSEYFDLTIDKVRSGGILLADNVLWSGHVLKPIEQQDHETRCLTNFNEKIRKDPRVTVTVLPIRDGLSLIIKN